VTKSYVNEKTDCLRQSGFVTKSQVEKRYGLQGHKVITSQVNACAWVTKTTCLPLAELKLVTLRHYDFVTRIVLSREVPASGGTQSMNHELCLSAKYCGGNNELRYGTYFCSTGSISTANFLILSNAAFSPESSISVDKRIKAPAVRFPINRPITTLDCCSK